MKPMFITALICCVFSAHTIAQTTDATEKAVPHLKQTAFVLGEASSKIAPAKPSSTAAAEQAAVQDQGGPGPLIATKAADGSITITHEGDPVSAEVVR